MTDPVPSIEQEKLDFEREKWAQEKIFRAEELDLRKKESDRSRWSNPLVIGIFAAAIAGVGNAFVAWYNSGEQSRLERERAESSRALSKQQAADTLKLEQEKAETARILEVIKTNDPDKAATNLQFLIDASLISDAETRTKIGSYLKDRKPGGGASLPGASGASLVNNCPYIVPNPEAAEYKENNQYALFVFYRSSRAADCQALVKGLAAEGFQANAIPTTFEEAGQYADNGVALVQPNNSDKGKKIASKVEGTTRRILQKVQVGDPYPLKRGDIQVFLY